MIENPVRSPMVPPIAESISTNFADLSFEILLNVGVSKNILTNLKLFFHSKSEIIDYLSLWGHGKEIYILDLHKIKCYLIYHCTLLDIE